MNIKGLVFVGFAAAVFASAANAAGDKIVTSKTYVDAKYVAAENGNITITHNTNTDKNEISADVPVKGIKKYGATDPIAPVNGIVELPEQQAAGTGTLSVTVGSANAVNFSANEATGNTVSVNVPVKSGAGEGLVPSSGTNDAGKYLKADGTWDTPDNTEYNPFSTSENGLVNKPTSADVTAGKILSAGNNWVDDADTTYAAGDHVTITGNNNAIGVTVNGTIAENDTGIVSGGTVYNYLNSASVQSDYSQTDNTKPDFIKNKPTIGSANLTITKGGSAYRTFSANATEGVTIDIPNAPDIPNPAEGTCTAAAPCALVWAGGTTPTWEPIQQ